MITQSYSLKRALSAALFVLLLSVVGKTKAQSFTVDNLSYSVYYNGNSVAVTGHTNGRYATGTLIIPEYVTYEGTVYTVTTILEAAFDGCSGLLGDLVIPNTVTSIDTYAFRNCSGFSSLTIGNSVTHIGSYAFSHCSGFTGTLTIPNSVTVIGMNAFWDCIGFTGNLVIPNSVTSLGRMAFWGCSGFSGTLTLSNSLTLIDDNTFDGCSGLTGDLIIPSSVTTINTSAFHNCNGFNGILEIPNTVTEIGDSAFEGCSGFIGSLNLPDSLTTIGEYMFTGCSGFSGNLVIPESVTSIGAFAFAKCSGFTGSLVIPNSVVTIGYGAFSECRGFTGTLTLSDSLMSIPSKAFYGCSGFTGDLIIPNSVVTIGGESTNALYGAFQRCGFTGNLLIGNSVTTIGSYSFSNCSNLSGELVLPNSITAICNDAFMGCRGFTGSLIIPNSITEISENAFYSCNGFTGDLVIPNSITTIGKNAFNGCSGFTSLTLGESVTTIEAGAFYSCKGFTGDLVIPNSVISIDDGLSGYYGAFSGCDGFSGNLILGSSLASIGKYAFYGCSGFTGNLIMSNSVTYIGEQAFYGCCGFTGNLSIPNSVTAILYEAFSGCYGFTGDLTIPDSVTTLGIRAFGGCNGLNGCLTIGCLVSAIPFDAFYGCSGITSVIIGNSVTTIGDSAFAECNNLTSVTLGHSISSIGFDTFWNTNIASLHVLNNNPPTLYVVNYGNYSFPYINLSIPVYVPCEALEAYQNAEGWNAFTNYHCIDWPSYSISTTANPSEAGTVGGTGTYYQNETCPLIATPNDGYTFVNWTKGDIEVSASPTYCPTVTEACDYVANFVLNDYTITVSANPETGGEVSGASNYNHGDSVSVNAMPSPGYTFINWTEDSRFASMDMDYSFIATENRELVANFTDTTDYLTVFTDIYPPEGGIVTGNGTYLPNQTAVLTANANEGYIFKNWTINGTIVSTSVSYAFTVNYSPSIVANFEEGNNIEFADSNVKAICVANWDINGDGELSYAEAASVSWISSSLFSNNTITSFDELQYFTSLLSVYSDTFQNCKDLVSVSIPMNVTNIGAYAFFRCSGLESMTIIARTPPAVEQLAFYGVDKSIPVYVPCSSLEAYQNSVGWNEFTNYHCLNGYSITTTVDPSFGGSVSGAGVYYQSETCTLTAMPNVGYSFVNWTKNGNVVSTSETYSFIVTESASYVANFAMNNYSVSAIVYPEIGGTVDGTGIYVHGSTATLNAIAHPGFSFVNWTENGSQVSIESEYSFIVNSDRNLVANFTESTNYHTVTIASNPEEGGSVEGGGDYLLGQTAVVTAYANDGYLFTNWTLDGVIVSTSMTYSFIVIHDISLVANFEQGNNIIFADSNVKALCVSHWDTNGDGELNYSEAAAVTSLGQVFSNNSTISSFDELQYFTGLTIINYLSFNDCIGLTSITLPNSVTGIGWYAFKGCTGLTSITIPNSITDIGQLAFWGCSNLLSVYYNGSVAQWCRINFYSNMANPLYYGHNLFINDELVDDLIIPNGTTNINNTAFQNATCLVSLTLGRSITSIGAYAFADCNELTSITVLANIPPALGDYAFRNVSKSIPVYVPCEALEAYQNAEGWNEFTNYLCFQGNITQATDFAQGWNWWSTYIEQDGINGLQMLEDGLGSNGVMIKSQGNGFVMNSSIGLWYGTLNSIENEATYLVDVNAPTVVEINGGFASPADHPITIQPGWNWIGFPSSNPITLADAFANFTPTEGDQVKSQGQFATFYGFWMGQLQNITPGIGLMYKSNNSTPQTLVYPNVGRNSEAIAMITDDLHWTNDIHAYPNNMTVMAVVELDGVELNSDRYELAAFANGECRGSAKLTFVEPINRHMAFLTISGDEATELSFGLYDSQIGTEIFDCSDILAYSTDATVGNLIEPMVIRFRGTTGLEDLDRQVQVFPNPVKLGERIHVGVEAETMGTVRIDIVNAFGIVVASTTSNALPASITAPAIPGVYMLRIAVDDQGICMRKLVVE